LRASTELEYLGITWNTRKNTKYLSKDKVTQLQGSIQKLLRRGRWSWHDAKVILGKLNFASFTVPLGRLHCRPVQRASRELPRDAPRQKFPIRETVKTELNWWMENIFKSSPIHHDSPSVFIATDAADLGWGAIVNSRRLEGRWSEDQRAWHSNMKELWTVHKVLRRLGTDLQGKTVMLQSDNRTTVAYLNAARLRRHKIGETSGRRNKNTSVLRENTMPLNRSTYPGHMQRNSRQLIERQNITRMASYGESPSTDIQGIRNTGDRSFCLSEVSSRTDVCERKRQRREQLVHRHFQQDMALQPWMDISTTSIDCEGTELPGKLVRTLHHHSSDLEQSVLDPRPEQEVNKTSPSDPRTPEKRDRPSHKASSGRDRSVAIGGLVGSGWIDHKLEPR
jgi:hypothetical protein